MTRAHYIIIANLIVILIQKEVIPMYMLDDAIELTSNLLVSETGNFDQKKFRKYILKKL